MAEPRNLQELFRPQEAGERQPLRRSVPPTLQRITKALSQEGAPHNVLVTYDGHMRASGVHIYVDGHERTLHVLFDYGIWPIEGVKDPLRIGAGTRLKVVEGLAMAKPMVSTTIGCEGIDVRPGEHL